MKLSLRVTKHMLYTFFVLLLGHIICKEKFISHPMNITIIVNFSMPKKVPMLRSTLGHIGYYHRFIKDYAKIMVHIEELLYKCLICMYHKLWKMIYQVKNMDGYGFNSSFSWFCKTFQCPLGCIWHCIRELFVMTGIHNRTPYVLW